MKIPAWSLSIWHPVAEPYSEQALCDCARCLACRALPVAERAAFERKVLEADARG